MNHNKNHHDLYDSLHYVHRSLKPSIAIAVQHFQEFQPTLVIKDFINKGACLKILVELPGSCLRASLHSANGRAGDQEVQFYLGRHSEALQIEERADSLLWSPPSTLN